MTEASSKILTGVERKFEADEIIVTKTDLNGKIIYANDVFINISGYTEDELIGKPHSMIRHPDMPRAVFRLFWERISSGDEIFAYVQNRSKNGDHYWVLAHVTPNFDQSGNILGYHSSRRVAGMKGLNAIRPIYQKLREIERGDPNRAAGLETSYRTLLDAVGGSVDGYIRFIMGVAR